MAALLLTLVLLGVFSAADTTTWPGLWGPSPNGAVADAATGRERWNVIAGPTYKGHDGSDDGRIATPAIAGRDVFALGPYGHLLAIDIATANVVDRHRRGRRRGAGRRRRRTLRARAGRARARPILSPGRKLSE